MISSFFVGILFAKMWLKLRINDAKMSSFMLNLNEGK